MSKLKLSSHARKNLLIRRGAFTEGTVIQDIKVNHHKVKRLSRDNCFYVRGVLGRYVISRDGTIVTFMKGIDDMYLYWLKRGAISGLSNEGMFWKFKNLCGVK